MYPHSVNESKAIRVILIFVPSFFRWHSGHHSGHARLTVSPFQNLSQVFDFSGTQLRYPVGKPRNHRRYENASSNKRYRR